MKSIYKILAFFIIFGACTPQTYYQLVETESKDLVKHLDYLSFENDDLQISYDFWGDRGSGSFIVFNKTDKDVFIDLKRSHLIINDFAHTYFQNRIYETPKISFFSAANEEEIKEQKKIKFPGITPKTITNQAADVVKFNEERIICIPPNCSQFVFGFYLQTELYRNCNLIRFPKPKELSSQEFSYEESPLQFRNRITYSFSEDITNYKSIENEFRAVKITNYPENGFLGSEYPKFCNDSSSLKTTIFIFSNNTSYYFKYKLDPGTIKH
ncbi:MAG: hypothetical protein PHP52_00030 [Bacteroidales bacterium]|nr:hypothetical protein [Bacteroidales bacterium]MDD4215968.1 hypothetical protein [Bacteroidales bacterium]MDY0140807.1 hypothetical protein [Bacteroidales bacterium]